jgi:acylphosphatase
VAQHLLIRGVVQGVGFREAMRAEAGRLGVTGWVRNRRDGSVEAMVDGSPGAVEAIVAWTRRGPPAALVTAVESAPAEGRYSAFERLPTA